MARLFAALVLLSGLLHDPLFGCSLCTSTVRKETLGLELEQAQLVVYGYVANSSLSVEAGALPGAGTAEFHVERLIKNDTKLPQPKLLTLSRYVPVLDPKDPPRFLLFGNVIQGKLDLNSGRQTKGPAVVEYVAGARPERARGKMAALQYYAKFLDHADEVIAQDAFLEFVRSSDEEVGQVAKTLDPARLRTLLKKPGLDADQISLFAFLLGTCGSAEDADYLQKRIERAQADDLRALDGMLGGFIALRPKEGWNLARGILADSHPNILKKYAALRTVRFYMGWKAAETTPTMLALYHTVIADGEMADMAIEDLRRWKNWELTAHILAQYAKPTHDAPIVKRGIVRYALSCPLPEARRFVDGLRDRDLVRELTDALEFEKKQ